jgi:hypothetical protein
MFEIKFDSALRTRLLARLQGMSPRLVSVLGVKLRGLMFMLQSKIVSEKLSGQVLHRRTGILSGSVRALPVTTAGNTISSGVQAGSGPAFYAAIHEQAALVRIKYSQPRLVLYLSLRRASAYSLKVLFVHR